MYIPGLPKALNSRSLIHLDKSRFTLDTSGVAGFFGGAEAASAMATVHICRNRKQWGWYNSPGSYEIAKRYGLLTKFGFFFGGGHNDPAELLTLFELDGQKGPPFLRVHSGTIIPETDHLAAVFMRASPLPACPIKPVKGRQPVGVTIAELDSRPEDDMELKPIPTRWDSRTLAALPIIINVGTCAVCAVNQDWLSFSLILLGIVANGVTCLIIGSVKLKFMRPRLAGESDHKEPMCVKQRRVTGVLITATDIVLLKGREDAAMAVACGKFVLPPSQRQFIAQLLLIPQGSLFGQIMFVTSLGVSWCYNLWLCSLDKTSIQQEILIKTILNLEDGNANTYGLESWPAMVVFVLLTLVFEDDETGEEELQTVLDALVEDTGKLWGIWKSAVLRPLRALTGPVSENDFDALVRELDVEDREADGLSGRDKLKLNALLKEARSGIEMFKTRVGDVQDLDKHSKTSSFVDPVKD